MSGQSNFPLFRYDSEERLRHMVYIAGAFPLLMLIVHLGIIWA
ncbi:MAG: hypothetical protein ACNI3A_10275 [Desulfovibrio sp.]